MVFQNNKTAAMLVFQTNCVGVELLVLLCVIFHTYMCCPRLCSHGGGLLLKCSAIGIGFSGAETNCGIARILGILLMNSWDT